MFQNQEPNASLLMENPVGSDSGASVVALNSFVNLHISTVGHTEQSYEGVRSVIFVIDLLGDYVEAMSALCKLVERVRRQGQDPCFDVFLHKADGLTPKERATVSAEISKQVGDELGELFSDGARPCVNFYLTSLYDHSILHAISRVVQRHMDESGSLAALLDTFCQETGADRCFLFDQLSKIYLAADSSSPEAADTAVHDLCNDAIDVVEDVAMIYNPQMHPMRHGPVTVAEIALDGGSRVVYVGLGRSLSLLLYATGAVFAVPPLDVLAGLQEQILQLLA